MRLIDADAEVKKREKLCEEKNCEYLKYRYQAMCKGCSIYEEIEAFDSAEEVEAEPVRHGRWLKYHTDYGAKYYCSACCINEIRVRTGEMFQIEEFVICPFCGARMNGGADNG